MKFTGGTGRMQWVALLKDCRFQRNLWTSCPLGAKSAPSREVKPLLIINQTAAARDQQEPRNLLVPNHFPSRRVASNGRANFEAFLCRDMISGIETQDELDCRPQAELENPWVVLSGKRAWYSIKARCKNSNHPRYSYYGGRGIRVCENWDASMETFIRDMGPKPSPLHSIDRKDNDGHYSCGYCPECLANSWTTNCRWATQLEQANNRRKTYTKRKARNSPQIVEQQIISVPVIKPVSSKVGVRATADGFFEVRVGGLFLGSFTNETDAAFAHDAVALLKRRPGETTILNCISIHPSLMEYFIE